MQYTQYGRQYYRMANNAEFRGITAQYNECNTLDSIIEWPTTMDFKIT